MLFRQLLDPETSTFTYLLADEDSRAAVIVDPVREQVARDVELIEQLELRLELALETLVHADHVTGGGLLRDRLGCRLAVGARSGVATCDLQLGDGDLVDFGRHALEVRETPGHTPGCVTYVCHEEGMAFTGDALLVRGCGRTDFQHGDSRSLFESVRTRILSLPDSTRLYPGHDYRGRTVTTVAEERRFNPRLGDGRSADEFVGIMDALKLAPPARMEEAVPANMASGVTEPEATTPSTLVADRWAPIERTVGGVPVVAPAWLAANANAVTVVDVREHIEFCGPLGHIEGALLIPLAQLPEHAASWDPDQSIVTVCTYGTRSGRAATWLAEAGFPRVASLHGGMIRWRDEGCPAVDVLADRAPQDGTVWLGMDI